MRLVPALLISAGLLAACSPSAPTGSTASESDAYSVAASSESLMKLATSASVPAAASGADATCLSQIGKAASDRLVERCIMVSPATHPPCNAANTCEMIQGEIDRSCAMYGADEKKPAECTS